jgi:hypothetical protein
MQLQSIARLAQVCPAVLNAQESIGLCEAAIEPGVTEFKMDDSKRSFREDLEYRIAVRLFESAFEACSRLPANDRDALLKDIAKRVLENLPQAISEEQKSIKIIGIEITPA